MQTSLFLRIKSIPSRCSKTALSIALVALITSIAVPSVHAVGAIRIGGAAFSGVSIAAGVVVDEDNEMDAKAAAQTACETATASYNPTGVVAQSIGNCTNALSHGTYMDGVFENACAVVVRRSGGLNNSTNIGFGIAPNCQAAMQEALVDCNFCGADPYLLPLNIDASMAGNPMLAIDPTNPEIGARFLIDGAGTVCPVGLANAATDDFTINCQAVGAVPTALTAVINPVGNVALSWAAPTDTSIGTITAYRIQRAVGVDSTNFRDLMDTADATTSYIDDGSIAGFSLAPGTVYRYRVRAIIAGTAGNASGIASAKTAVVAPSNLVLTATAIGNIIHLGWGEIRSDGGDPLITYSLQRSSMISGGALVSPVQVTLPNNTDRFFYDSGLALSTTYHYQVTATNSGGSVMSNIALATTTAVVAPSGLTLTHARDTVTGDRTLTWTLANNGGEAVTYRLQRTRVDSGNGASSATPTQLVELPNDATLSGTYTDTAAPSGGRMHYIYSIRATNSAGMVVAGFNTTGEMSGVTSEPQNLTLGEVTATTVALNWEAPSSDGNGTGTGGGFILQGYFIERAQGANPFMALPQLTASTTIMYTDTTVMEDTTYSYRVRSTNPVGESAPSNIVTAMTMVAPTPPDAPVLQVVTGSTTATSIRLSWAAPADNGSMINGYEIQRAEGGGGFADLTPPPVFSGAARGYIDIGLAPNTQYSYQLRAVNAIGTGSPSTALVATTLPTPPAAPVNLRVTGSTATSIDLEWNEVVPAAVGGNMIVGYEIQRAERVGGRDPVEADFESLIPPPTGTSTSYTDPDPADPTATPLSLGTTYQYRVRAIDRNAAGGESPGAFSGTATVTTTAVVPPDAPGTPTVVGGGGVGTSSVAFSWLPPADNGSTITDYQIERAVVSAGVVGGFSLLRTVGSPTITYTDPRPGTPLLDANATYHYQVSAINAIGTGSPSAVLVVTTRPVAPDAPGSLTVTMTGTSSVTLTWNTPNDNGGPLSGYRIERTGGVAGTFMSDIGVSNTYTDMNGLVPGTTYQYRILAINTNASGSAESNFSEPPVPAVTLPEAPENLMVTGSTTSSIMLSWTQPTNNGDSPITGYEVQRAEGGGGFADLTPPPVLDGAARSYNDTTVDSDTQYSYQVRALNVAGAGAFVTLANNVFTLPAPTGSPTGLTVVADGATVDGSIIVDAVTGDSITLSWTAPATNPGDPAVSAYRIERAEGGGAFNDLNPHPMLTGASTSHTDTGLSPGTTYRYRVSAINTGAGGTMSRSVPSTELEETTDIIAPDAPTLDGMNIVVDPNGMQITLNWTDGSTGGSPIMSYNIQRTVGDGVVDANFAPVTPDGSPVPFTDVVVTGTTISYTDTNGLSPGIQYSYQISAFNGSFDSGFSNTVTETTAIIEPSGLELTAMLISATEVELSWTLEATGGAAVTYELERSVNSDLSAPTLVDSGTATSFTDSGLTAGTQYYYQVTATNSADSVTSAIVTPTGGLSERAQALNESLLPIIAQTASAMTLDAISNRIDNVVSGAGNVNTFAGADSSHAIIKQLGSDLSSEQELGDMLLKWLGNSSFSHSLAGSGIAGGAGLSVWGSGDYKDLDNEDNALRWDGNVWGLSVGADVQLNADWLLGTAVSWSSGEFDYTDRATESIGDYDYENFGIHPYFNWAPSGAGYNIWGSASYGSGEIEIRDQAMPGAVSSDTSQYGVAAGINLTLSSSHSQQASHSIDLKSDVSALWVDIDGSGEDILSDTIQHQRARLLLSSEHDYLIGAQRHLIPSIEFGGRYDTGGGAEDGTGIELAASLSYKDLLAGFMLSGRMNTLLGADYDEWGASALLRFGDGGASSRGLSFSLEPTIGRASSDPSRLWQQGLSDLSNSSSSLSGSLVSEIAYGMGMHSAFSVPATWQPYANMELGSAIRRYRLGLRYQFVQGLGFRIEGQSLRNSGASTTDSNTGKDYGVQLKTEFEF